MGTNDTAKGDLPGKCQVWLYDSGGNGQGHGGLSDVLLDLTGEGKELEDEWMDPAGQQLGVWLVLAARFSFFTESQNG